MTAIQIFFTAVSALSLCAVSLGLVTVRERFFKHPVLRLVVIVSFLAFLYASVIFQSFMTNFNRKIDDPLIIVEMSCLLTLIFFVLPRKKRR